MVAMMWQHQVQRLTSVNRKEFKQYKESIKEWQSVKQGQWVQSGNPLCLCSDICGGLKSSQQLILT